jgi:hypothetical protein
LGDEQFAKLLEPGQIGQVKTKNRMVKTGQGSSVILYALPAK